MALTLTIRSGDAAPQAVAFDAPRIVLGRAEGCDVLLPDPSVSHRHASIRQRGSDYILLDENSTNGTFVGPLRLSEGAPRVLKSGDLIRLGRVWLEVELAHSVPTPNPGQLTKEIALRLISSALEADGAAHAHPEIKVLGGASTGQALVLSRFGSPYSIGRGKGSDLNLEDEGISRRHLEVTRRGLHVFVRELASKNGAMLGDAPLEHNLETLWSRSRRLVASQCTLELHDAVADVLAELDAAPDEVLDQPIEPPSSRASGGLQPTPRPPATAEVAEADRRYAARASSRAPAASAAPRTSAGSRPSVARGWNNADLLVALLAVVMIAASLGGLSWLFGG